MKFRIGIAPAARLVAGICASGTADAAGKLGRSADGVSCGFSLPQTATPAARCAALKRQCGGRFDASACGDRLLSAAN